MIAEAAASRARLWFALAAVLLVIPQCRFGPEPARQENYVTVRLHDSLSRFDSVQVLILAGGDTSAVVGTLWSGPLRSPSAIPSYRVSDGESRPLSIRVRGWYADGRLALDEILANVNGKPVVIDAPIPKPSPRLASLALSYGTLVPPFDPSVHAYSAAVPYPIGTVQVTASPAYAPAQLYVGVQAALAGVPSDPMPMNVGENPITLTVSASDTTDRYVITVTRSSNPSDTTAPVDTAKPPIDTTRDPGDTAIIPGEDASSYATWQHKGVVLLRFSAMGLPPDFTVYDFPLLLRLSKDNFKFNQAADSGRDIRFATARGKALGYEIARWDAANQQAEIFIRCDSLSAKKDAVPIVMYWGKPTATKLSRGSLVFTTSLGWTGAWHLEEAGTGRGNEYKDATGIYDGTGDGAIPTRKEGIVGHAQEFKSSNKASCIKVPHSFDPGPQKFTLSMWVYREGLEEARLINKDGDGNSDQRFEIAQTANSGQIAFGRNGNRINTDIYLPMDNWMLLGLVFDGSLLHFYVDGAERESHPFSIGGDRLGDVTIGNDGPDGDFGYHGMLDEIWSSNRAKDANFIRLMYENQKPSSSFATVSPL